MSPLDVVVFLILLSTCVIGALPPSKKKSPQRNPMKNQMIVPFPVKIKALKCQATNCKCTCGGTVEDVEDAIQQCWRKGACGFNRISTNKLQRRGEKATHLIIPSLLESRPAVKAVLHEPHMEKKNEECMEVSFNEPLEIYVPPPKKKKK